MVIALLQVVRPREKRKGPRKYNCVPLPQPLPIFLLPGCHETTRSALLCDPTMPFAILRPTVVEAANPRLKPEIIGKHDFPPPT